MDDVREDTLMTEGNDTDGDGMSATGTAETKPQEIFTKPGRDGIIEYIEREVDRFDFEGYEVVRKELFSKANCPAVTLKYGSISFNCRAIRKLDECSHIQILINQERKLMIAKPCGEDEKDSVQWSKVDKHGKVVPRKITGKYFTWQLFGDMKWDINATMKMLGTLLTCKSERIFVFDLVNAEAYISVSAMDPENPNRRKRVPYSPKHWEGHYGPSYEDSRMEVVKTFEGVPEGFVKITLPSTPSKKPAEDKAEPNESNKEDTTNGNV